MHKAGILFGALVMVATLGQAAELTATEQRWLQGVAPVLSFARQNGVPLDVLVQPQATPGQAPLALGFVDGRCKLVLSMRGNPEAQATLERIAPELLDVTLELMAAHELGHCRRYLDGAWYRLPAGFAADLPRGLPPALRAAVAEMKAARREEGYGDLVGLAWVEQQHPQHYRRLWAWLNAERTKALQPGSHHDTLAWLKLARSGIGPGAPSIYAAATTLWLDGLAAAD